MAVIIKNMLNKAFFLLKERAVVWLCISWGAQRSIRHLNSVTLSGLICSVAKQQKMLQSWRPSKALWALHRCLLFPQRPQSMSECPGGCTVILHPLSLIPVPYLLSLERSFTILEGLQYCSYFGPTDSLDFSKNNKVFTISQIRPSLSHYPCSLFLCNMLLLLTVPVRIIITFKIQDSKNY